ncbi:MAG: PAS domain S-box protein [Candidatus Omnitrophota bacterium]
MSKKNSHLPHLPVGFCQLVTESAADGIFTVDLKGQITFANRALVDLINIPLSKTLGTHFEKYVHRASQAKAMRCFLMAKKGQRQVGEEIDVIDSRHNVIPVEVNASPLFQDKKIIGVHAVVRDIRRRRHLEKLLRESEKKYRDLFEDANDVLIIADLNGIILDANRQAEQLFKRPKKELVGIHQSQLYPIEHEAAYNAIFSRSLKGKSEPCDLEVTRSDGQEIPVSVFCRRITAGDREVILIRFSDLSERVRNEEKIRETNKMMALSLFVSGTAQEIKHPLKAVLAHIQQLVSKYSNRDFEYIGFKEFSDIMQTIRSVSNQIRYCCDINDKLLLLNRKRAGIKEKDCDVNSVLRESLKAFTQQLKLANVKPVLRLATSLPRAAISVVEFDQVITNIFSNSLQAMPSGGQFTVRTFYDHETSHVEIEFHDTGLGIPKENLPRIFEPFFTTKQVGPGKNSGLGLSIVYSIVKSCRGDVTVKSSLRSGTTFKVILPISRTQKIKK